MKPITILLLAICIVLTGCYGNLRHGNRMYDSSQMYFRKSQEYYQRASNLHGIKKSEAYGDQAEIYERKALMYADSMDYYLSRRFERER